MARRPPAKNAVGVRAGMMQAIEPAVMASGALEGDQIGDVLGDLDLFALVPAARVGGNDGGAVDDAHAIEGGVHHHVVRRTEVWGTE